MVITAWSNYRKTKDHPYIIGDFVWTGIDYIGESGIGRWYYEGDVPGEHYERPLYPWHAAYCGDIDLTGLRKPISHYRSMLWNEDANTSDLTYIVIEMVDDEGNLVPLADNVVTVEVDGKATLQALGNADIKDNDPYFDSKHKVWKGRALAVVRSNGQKGASTVKVSSPGLKTKTARLTSR